MWLVSSDFPYVGYVFSLHVQTTREVDLSVGVGFCVGQGLFVTIVGECLGVG